jgi:hypothetical protein
MPLAAPEDVPLVAPDDAPLVVPDDPTPLVAPVEMPLLDPDPIPFEPVAAPAPEDAVDPPLGVPQAANPMARKAAYPNQRILPSISLEPRRSNTNRCHQRTHELST